MKKESIWRRGWLLLLLGVAVLMIIPVGMTIMRIMIILGAIVLWISGLFVFRSSRVYKILFVLLGILAVIVFVVPGGRGDSELLREAYVESLQATRESSMYGPARTGWGSTARGWCGKGILTPT